MSRDELATLLEEATNALADISTMDNSDLARRKARRIYEQIRAVWHGPGPDDDATAPDEAEAVWEEGT